MKLRLRFAPAPSAGGAAHFKFAEFKPADTRAVRGRGSGDEEMKLRLRFAPAPSAGGAAHFKFAEFKPADTRAVRRRGSARRRAPPARRPHPRRPRAGQRETTANAAGDITPAPSAGGAAAIHTPRSPHSRTRAVRGRGSALRDWLHTAFRYCSGIAVKPVSLHPHAAMRLPRRRFPHEHRRMLGDGGYPVEH